MATKKKREITIPEGVTTGWRCARPDCGRWAMPDAVKAIDPRYTTGVCPKHGKAALVRGEMSPLRVEVHAE